MSVPGSGRLARASVIMSAGSVVSRALGLVKMIALASAIGVTFAPANAFDVANKIPNTVHMLLAGGVLNAILVPQIVKASKRADGGQGYTDRLLTLTISALLIITFAATALGGVLVWVYTSLGSSSWSSEQMALATAFAYWCLPQVFFYGLYTLLGEVLNARASFGPVMWAPVLNNVVAIAGLISFIVLFGPGAAGQHGMHDWDAPKIAVLAGTATLGVVAQALILIWPLRRSGFHFVPHFSWRGVGLGSASRVAIWVFARLVIAQLGLVVTSNVAAGVHQTDASNAAYTLGYLVFMLPHGLAAVSVGTALFTPMSHHATEHNLSAVRADLSMGIRTVAVITILSTAGVLVLGGPIGFALAGGSPTQGMAVGRVITAMCLGIVPFTTLYMFSRVFYAFENARTPFFIQLWTVACTTAGVLVSSTVPDRWVVVGIGISMSVGNTIGATIAAYLARRQLNGIDGRRLRRTYLRLIAAAIAPLAIGAGLLYVLQQFAWSGRVEAFLTVVIVGIPMVIVYLLMGLALKVEELQQLRRMVTNRISSRGG
jgi:putative peptidoglycan lipid II flippase